MLGVGHSLVKPQLTNDQELDAEVIHRQFGSKVVWLLPTRDLAGKLKVCKYHVATALIRMCFRLKQWNIIPDEIFQIEIKHITIIYNINL